jgi:surfeit locus 1 family protein
MISRLFRRPWIFVTILVIIAALVMIRLGIWQLDRLAGRRAFNEQVLSQIDEAPLAMTDDVVSGDLEALEFRTVLIEGEYDLSNTLVLGNQVWGDQMGVHLLTPLKIADTETVILIDRGWIPFEDWENRELGVYDEVGTVNVEGMLRVTQTKLGLRDCLDETAGETPFQVWCLALEGIAAHLPYDLLPVYLIQAPDGEQTALPYRAVPQIEVSEGPHLSYAIQWFTFATILLVGYPFFVNREIKARARKVREEAGEATDTPDDEYHGWAEHLEEEQIDVYGVNDDA